MAERPRLVVGLGNPGPRYEKTRHNAGFWLVERLAARLGAGFRTERRFSLQACGASTPAGQVRLVKPTTWMNRSGQAVGAIAEYYRIAPEAILVAHDELDLPTGTVRLKEGGGHGGHNGLRDVAAHLGSRGFVRIRLGIGRPPAGLDPVDYVLQRPGRGERERIDGAIEQTLEWASAILAGDLQRAMKALHTRQDPGAPADGADGGRGTDRPPPDGRRAGAKAGERETADPGPPGGLPQGRRPETGRGAVRKRKEHPPGGGAGPEGIEAAAGREPAPAAPRERRAAAGIPAGTEPARTV